MPSSANLSSEHEYLAWLVENEYLTAYAAIFDELHAAIARQDVSEFLRLEGEAPQKLHAIALQRIKKLDLIARLKIDSDIKSQSQHHV